MLSGLELGATTAEFFKVCKIARVNLYNDF